jgi:hypothetical protein
LTENVDGKSLFANHISGEGIELKQLSARVTQNAAPDSDSVISEFGEISAVQCTITSISFK